MKTLSFQQREDSAPNNKASYLVISLVSIMWDGLDKSGVNEKTQHRDKLGNRVMLKELLKFPSKTRIQKIRGILYYQLQALNITSHL